MKKLIILFAVMIFSVSVFGQSVSDTIFHFKGDEIWLKDNGWQIIADTIPAILLVSRDNVDGSPIYTLKGFVVKKPIGMMRYNYHYDDTYYLDSNKKRLSNDWTIWGSKQLR